MCRRWREVPLNLSGPDNNGPDETDEFRANISGHYRWRVRFGVRGKMPNETRARLEIAFPSFSNSAEKRIANRKSTVCVRVFRPHGHDAERAKRGRFTIDKNVFPSGTTNLVVPSGFRKICKRFFAPFADNENDEQSFWHKSPCKMNS